MPKSTFFNLSEEKRNRFIDVAFAEFSQNTYQHASINTIIKRLGIARGSVYQYFEDKMDLWFFLKEYAEMRKMEFLIAIDRNDYFSFWDYYKAIFINGLNFDEQYPDCSKFLYLLGNKENSPEIVQYIDTWKKKAYDMLTLMVEDERNRNDFSPEISKELIVHFLIVSSMSISELLQHKYKMNFDKNIHDSGNVLGHDRSDLLAAIDDLMSIIQKALK